MDERQHLKKCQFKEENQRKVRFWFILVVAIIIVLLITSIALIINFSIELYAVPKYRFTSKVGLAIPEPVLPSVPAVLLSVRGNSTVSAELTPVWSTVNEWDPPQVIVSLSDEQVAQDFVFEHRSFVLNIVPAEYAFDLDVCDMNSHKFVDKFQLTRFTPVEAETIDSVMVKQSLIQLECKVTDFYRVPPKRFIFIADVTKTWIEKGIYDLPHGKQPIKLNVKKAPFFALAAGSGEFHTMGTKVGFYTMSLKK